MRIIHRLLRERQLSFSYTLKTAKTGSLCDSIVNVLRLLVFEEPLFREFGSRLVLALART